MYEVDESVEYTEKGDLCGVIVKVDDELISEKEYPTLGFFEGLGKEKVAKLDLLKLVKRITLLTGLVAKLEKSSNDTKKDLQRSELEVVRLKDELKKIESDKLHTEQKSNFETLYEIEVDNHGLTLKLLKDSQNELNTIKALLTDTQTELNRIKATLAKDKEVESDCNCKHAPVPEYVIPTKISTVAEESPVKLVKKATPKVAVKKETKKSTKKKETKVEGKIPTSEEVVNSSSLLEKFIKDLSDVEKTNLKADILKGYENDKRISTTLNNWILKYPVLETQIYFMFKTALNRRRGEVIKPWYKRFDDLVAKNSK